MGTGKTSGEMMNNKSEIIYWLNRCYNKEYTTISGGNLSCLSDDRIFCTPTGKDKGNLSEKDIAVISFNDMRPENENNPTMEINMHKAIYTVRNDVKYIMHIHPTYCSMFSALKRRIRTDIMSESYIVLPEVGYVNYSMPSTKKLAEDAAEALKTTDAVILRNHGIITVGKSFRECFTKAEVLEHSAKIQYLLHDSKDIRYLTDNEKKEIESNFHS